MRTRFKIAGSALAVLLISSCATILGGLIGQLFPTVDAPEGPSSSMLVVELIAYTRGEEGTEESRNYNNLVNSGFFPVVVGPGGFELAFQNIDAVATSGMLYVEENIQPGTYTLEGFRYLWMTHTDYVNTPIKDLKFDGQNAAEWQRTNFYPLPSPVKIQVKPGAVQTLGRYTVFYTLKDTGDERYNTASWEYQQILPETDNSLRVMKSWEANNWPAWSERNSADPR